MQNNKQFLHLLHGRKKKIPIEELSFDAGHGSFSRGKRGIAGSMVFDNLMRDYGIDSSPVVRALSDTLYETMEEFDEGLERINQNRMIQNITEQIRQVAQPYIGRTNDDYNYWSMVSATERTMREAVDRGAIREGAVRVNSEGSNVTVEFRPNTMAQYITVDVDLNS